MDKTFNGKANYYNPARSAYRVLEFAFKSRDFLGLFHAHVLQLTDFRLQVFQVSLLLQRAVLKQTINTFST